MADPDQPDRAAVADPDQPDRPAVAEADQPDRPGARLDLPDLRAELEREVRRVSDRLRALSPSRLADPVPGHGTRAAVGRAAAQTLADAAEALEAGVERRGAVRRTLPVVADLAVGDQVAVTGTDLLLASRAAPPGVPVPAADPPGTPERLLAGALEQLRHARRVL